jgi:drug/metabolite transporter (DMT)-like permease
VSLVVVSLHPVLLIAIEALGGARPGRTRVAGVALAIAGTVWLALAESESAGGSVVGILLGVASALGMVGYLLAGKRAGRVLPAEVYAQRAYFVASCWLGVGIYLSGHSLIPENANEWRIAALSALFPTLLGHTPMNAALRHLPASVVSTAFLGEVVGASLLVWAFLHEVPPRGAWLGGAAIAAGILLVARTTRRAVR